MTASRSERTVVAIIRLHIFTGARIAVPEVSTGPPCLELAGWRGHLPYSLRLCAAQPWYKEPCQ